jgi:hypothetical protein
MNIGIDFDGVINTNNAIEMAILENVIARNLGYPVCNQNAPNSQSRYGFNDADYEIYQRLRHNHINSEQFFAEMRMMPGTNDAIKVLNDMGHKTYLVTVRGCNSDGGSDANVREYVCQTLSKWGLLDNGLLVDENHSFYDPTEEQVGKAIRCKNLNITVLVDDELKNVQELRQAGFHAVHFGVEASNWQEVITQIRELT